ncbi:hypothetical protein ACJX0J_038261, partial [Zea mays]
GVWHTRFSNKKRFLCSITKSYVNSRPLDHPKMLELHATFFTDVHDLNLEFNME